MSGGDSDDVTVLDPPQLADNDVNGMILAVARDNPAAALKFRVTTPSIVAKQKKAQEHQEKRASTRRKPEANAEGSRSNKAKKAESDDEEAIPSITYYINIPKLSVPARTKRGSKATEDDILQKGPFSLRATDSYEKRLSAIATELPCREENINESKILWKPKKPKNADKLPLSKAKGYKEMVKEMRVKKDDVRTVYLFMPPPMKLVDDELPWDTDEALVPKFDYSELEPTGFSDTIEQQKITFNKATKAERAKLEETYPIGNYPNFPHLRVYFDPQTKFYYELNATRLALALPLTPAPALSATPAPTHSLSDLLFASLLSQSGGGGGLRLLFPQLNTSLPAASQPSAPHLPRTAPPSPVKRHNVTLERFCDSYGIDEGNAALLREVGFCPGDPTDPTVDDELKKMGFTIFSWRRIHAANIHFKADLANGHFE
ncbi:hypothetical protein C8R44DRAFT_744774 [Mycena epipterygia]|nr:hypothetical protein C8R44DRAFT_744774 [Mycena epipterygia]